MIWMTPGVLAGGIRRLFNNSEANKKRGTVNVVTKVSYCSGLGLFIFSV